MLRGQVYLNHNFATIDYIKKRKLNKRINDHFDCSKIDIPNSSTKVYEK